MSGGAANAWRVARFAVADLVAEWRFALVLIFNVASVVAPILLFIGLRDGVVEPLRAALTKDPAARELTLIGQERFAPQWFARATTHPEVAFIAPKTRFLNTALRARSLADRMLPIATVDVEPSGRGDPLLAVADAERIGGLDVVVSEALARSLALAPTPDAPAEFQAIVQRRLDGVSQATRLTLRAIGVAPLWATPSEVIFADPAFLLGVERYREGGSLDFAPLNAEETVASFRLYAKSIEQVAPLRERLRAEGLRVDTQAAKIEATLRLNAGLGLLIAAVASLMIVGGLLSVAMSVSSNAFRKARELSVLSLLGFRSLELTVFPMTQAVIVAVLGGALGVAIYLAGGGAVAELIGRHLDVDPSAFGFSFALAAATLAAAIAGGALASCGAALATLRLDPTEKLRDV